MSLTITADMITELSEKHGYATEVGIVLGMYGWEVSIITGGLPAEQTAYNLADIQAITDGEPMTNDIAERLASHDPYNRDWTIPTETASTTADADWRVVTKPEGWDNAWAFNLDTARLIIEGPGLSSLVNRSRDLWITDTGRYVSYSVSQYRSEPEHWAEITLVDAAQWAYETDYDVVDNPPQLIAAARAARDLVDTMAAPSMSDNTNAQVRAASAHRQLEPAARTYRDAAIISDLIRSQVLPDILDERGKAAAIVVADHNGNQVEAAAYLGVHQSRLSRVLSRR